MVMANLREVKAMIIEKAARGVRRKMFGVTTEDRKMARAIIRDMGLKDSLAVRQRIIRACNELEDRYS